MVADHIFADLHSKRLKRSDIQKNNAGLSR